MVFLELDLVMFGGMDIILVDEFVCDSDINGFVFGWFYYMYDLDW